MKTLGRNADNDLYLEAGELAILHDADAQCAIIESVLQTQKGELQFDEDGGIDYFGTILQSPTTINFWAAQVTSRVEALDFVAAVEDFQYRFDRDTCTLYWSMTVINTSDERLDLQNKKTVLDGSPGISIDWNNIYDKPANATEAINMVEAMHEAALEAPGIYDNSPLSRVKNVLNEIVYDANSEQYAKSKLLTFVLEGVPLGTIIDFSNFRLNLQDSNGFQPFSIEISDGTKVRISQNTDAAEGATDYNLTPLAATGNRIWFYGTPTYNASDTEHAHPIYPITYKHTIMESGDVTITIRGNITGLLSADCAKPILLRSDSSPFPYLSYVKVGERVLIDTIGTGGFSGYKNLKGIEWNVADDASLPISFGDNAFSGCESLATLSWMPAQIVSIGTECFKGCKGLKNLEGLRVGNSTTLPDGCFENCIGLTSIKGLPSTITSLGDKAFCGCTSLQTIEDLSDSITDFGESCFEGCIGLRKVLFFPGALTSIPRACFKGCANIRSLYIPLSIGTMGQEAFAGCTSLTNVMCARYESNPSTITIVQDDTFDQEKLDVYVPKGALDAYSTATGWEKYWVSGNETIYEYGQIEFQLADVVEGLQILGTTGVVNSDSIWQVEYTGTSAKPRRFESTDTAFPSFTYDIVPTDNGTLGAARIILKGFITRLAASSSQAYPFLATIEGGENTYLKGIRCTLGTSLQIIGDYAFAKCTDLSIAEADVEGNDLPFHIGAYAFYNCSSMESMAWVSNFTGLGALVEDGTALEAFGEGCFCNSGIVELDYIQTHVTSLSDYCFSGTKLVSLDNIVPASGISVLTSIGKHCFENCSNLSSISELSRTAVTEVPEYAFAGCTSLGSISGIENLERLGIYAFQGCTTIENISILASAFSIIAIPIGCFAGCTTLKTLDGIANITEIGDFAFSGCTSLNSLMAMLPTTIGTIPAYCFEGCTALRTLVGCYNITAIEEGAFSGCTGLLSSSGLGPNIQAIGNEAFLGCTGLRFFTCISNSNAIPTLGQNVFGGLETTLPLYVRDGMQEDYGSAEGWKNFQTKASRSIKITFENLEPTDLEDSEDSNVVSNSQITAAIIDDADPENSIVVPGVWYVDFGDGTDFEVAYAENGTKTIPEHHFTERGAYTLTLFGDIVQIQGSSQEYDPSIHADPTNINTPPCFLQGVNNKASEVLINSNYLVKLGDFCFCNYGRDNNNLLVSLSVKPNGEIGAYAFAKTSGFENYGTIGEVDVCTASVIGEYAFYNSGLSSSAAFNYVIETKTGAFAQNSNLPDLTGFSVIETIGAQTYSGCTSLVTTNGIQACQTIGDMAFADCTGLTVVSDLGENLTSIGANAFQGCVNITTVFVANTTPPILPSNGFESSIFSSATVYVPAGTEEVYRKTDYWNMFTDAQDNSLIRSRSITFHLANVKDGDFIPRGSAIVSATGTWTIAYGTQQVKLYNVGDTLESYTFQDGGAGEYEIDITISGAVVGLSGLADGSPIFGTANASKLRTVSSSIAMEIETLGDNLFAGCTNLVSITSTPSVVTIGNNTFRNAASLSNISGLTNVTSIGAGAFSGCSSLVNLFGLSSVVTIGDNAFSRCTSLAVIDGLGTNVTSIGKSAFSGCPLTEVQMFAATPPTIEEDTFGTLNVSAIPLYVRTKSISAYKTSAGWRDFENITSRYVEFTLTECPSYLRVEGGVGTIMSNTFWVVDWDADNCNGIPSVAGMTTSLPAHTYILSGNHTLRIEGAITGIGVNDENYSVVENEPSTQNEITGRSFVTLSLNGDTVAYGRHYLTKVKRSELSPLVSIGKAAFLHNLNLHKVELSGVSTIGESAFAFSGIEDLVVLESATLIEDYAFYGCTYLQNVFNLNGTSIIIGDYAFARIGELQYIQITVPNAANAAITNTSFGYFATPQDQKAVKVYVPIAARQSYIENEYWNKFTIATQTVEFTLENVPSGTTIIGLSGSDNVGVAKVEAVSVWSIDWDDGKTNTMHQQDTGFPEHTYEYREDLPQEQKELWTAVTIDNITTWVRPKITITVSGSLTSIGCQSPANSPFLAVQRGMGNPYLTKIEASDEMVTLEELGDSVFQRCGSLVQVLGFTHVKSIGAYAFQGCEQLADIGMAIVAGYDEHNYAELEGDGFLSVVSVGGNAFAGCTNLSSLNSFPSLRYIGARAFADCIGLSGITGLGAKYKKISAAQYETDGLAARFGAYAFDGCDFNFIDVENFQYPPTIQTSTFPGDPKQVFVFVSEEEGVQERYRNAPVWMMYFYRIVASSTISIAIAEGKITNPTERGGVAIYGNNGLLQFTGNYLLIDWGDGTTTEVLESNAGSSGWTFPNHFYTKPLNGSPVTIQIRGPVTKIYTNDANDGRQLTPGSYHPFIALTTYETTTTTDPVTGNTTTTSTIVPPSYSSSEAWITKLSFGEGSTLERIGSCCFQDCGISAVEIGRPLNDGQIEIGDFAFKSGSIATSTLTTVTCLEEGTISSIGRYAFYNNSQLKDVAFLAGCTSIGDFAFYNCVALNTIELTSEVATIGQYAFTQCTGATSLSWGADAEISADMPSYSMGTQAFARCSALESIEALPPALKISQQAFYQCTSLKGIYLHNTILGIGSQAFAGCSGIVTGIEWEAATEDTIYYKNGVLTKVLEATDITIGSEAFVNTSAPSGSSWSVQIPPQVTQLGAGAFRLCGMTSFSWNSSDSLSYSLVESTASGVFQSCPNLTNVLAFPAVTSLPMLTFKQCSLLSGTDFIPSSVIAIGRECFYGCSLSNGIKLTWNDGVTTTEMGALQTIGTSAFESTRAQVLHLSRKVQNIGARAFALCENLVEVHLSTSLTSQRITIGDYAFFKCTMLQEVNSLLNYTEGAIGAYAFARCTSLQNVVVPGAVTQLGEGCFNCSAWLDDDTYTTLAAALAAASAPTNPLQLDNDGSEGAVGPLSVRWNFTPGSATTTEVDQASETLDFLTNMVPMHLDTSKLPQIVGKCLSRLNFKTNSSVTAGDFQLIIYAADAPTTTVNGIVQLVNAEDVIGRSSTVQVSLGSTNYAFSFTFFNGVLKSNTEYYLSFVKPDSVQFKEFGLRVTTTISAANAYLFFPTTSDNPKTPWSQLYYENAPRYIMGDGCFMNCTALASADKVWPVRSISQYAFYNCTNLAYLDFLTSISYLGNHCFSKSGITELPDFAEEVGYIGVGAFKDCTSLVSVVGNIPNVDSLPDETFSGCTALANIGSADTPFPTTITTLGTACFKDCKSLTLDGISKIGLHINRIGTSCFEGCTNQFFSSFSGFASVFDYPQRCFYGCSSLRSILALSSSGSSVTINPKYQSNNNTSESNVRLKFYPRQIGLEYGWCMKTFTLRTRNAFQYAWPSGTYKYRLEVYDGAIKVDESDEVTITAADTAYTFEFTSNFSEYANKGYVINIICTYNSTGYDSIGLALNDTASIEPGLYKMGSGGNSWLVPIWSMEIQLKATPVLHNEAFGGCPDIQSIDLSSYTDVVEVDVSGTDIGPFDSSVKTNATLYVPNSIKHSYEIDAYWQGFGDNIVGV